MSGDTAPTSPTQTRISISNAELIKDGEALRSPRYRPGAAGFKAKENKHKFAFSSRQFGRLVNPDKSLPVFYRFGGLAGLERGLRTDRHCGLSSEETVLDEFVLDSANHNLALADTETRTLTEKEALEPVAIARLTAIWTRKSSQSLPPVPLKRAS